MSDPNEIWQPLATEPDPYEAAVRDVIRYRLPAVFGERFDGAKQIAQDRVMLPDGATADVRLSCVPLAPKSWKGRQAVCFALEGGLAANGTLFVIGAEVVVDQRTQAFLDLRVRFEQRQNVR